jgi:hypothetical protein
MEDPATRKSDKLHTIVKLCMIVRILVDVLGESRLAPKGELGDQQVCYYSTV